MVRILILEDDGFESCKSALQEFSGQEVQIMNDEDNEARVHFKDVAGLISKYYDDIDLVIVDLQLPDESHNGLMAINAWVADQESLQPQNLNFGIIAITNHTETEARKVLEKASNLFGNCFLGLAIKGFSLGRQLQRLITNGFLTPPFIRGGDKYFNAGLAAERFAQFNKAIQIRVRKKREIEEIISVAFSDIIIMQSQGDGLSRVYTKDGYYEGQLIAEGVALSFEGFYKKSLYCYDPALVPYTKDNGTTGYRKEYHLPSAMWQEEELREQTVMENRNLSEARIGKKLMKSLPVFVASTPSIIVNILYVKSFASELKRKYFEENVPITTFNLDSYNNVLGAVNITFINKKDLLKPDQNVAPGRYILTNQYLPVYGRELNLIENKDGIVRYQDIFFDRAFAFNELCSDRWQPLFKQLRRHYGIE